jgi:predicted kinase
MMDLEAHGRRDLAFAFLNAYLETSGDYAGIRLLPFYFVYRAVVRAKINLIRAAQTTSTVAERGQAMTDYRRYIMLAAAYTRGLSGAIVITHGFSGSGKTTLTRPLLAAFGAVRVRSDIERKRSHGLHALARTGAAVGEGLYADETTARTYEGLLEHARIIAGAGFPVIVDATFLQARATRAISGAGLPSSPFHLQSSTLRQNPRSCARGWRLGTARGDDASEATLPILQAQLKYREALTDDELRFATEARSGNEAAAHVLCEKIT